MQCRVLKLYVVSDIRKTSKITKSHVDSTKLHISHIKKNSLFNKVYVKLKLASTFILFSGTVFKLVYI